MHVTYPNKNYKKIVATFLREDLTGDIVQEVLFVESKTVI